MTMKAAPSYKPVSIWLFICSFAVLLMAVIGAVTRLTESGLSIVEWKPVLGALPPLSDADWHNEFALYKETPQYQKVNMGMTLSEFKSIYFWEWRHRLWGRVIGVIFIVPFLVFGLRNKLPPRSAGAFIGVFFLGGLQGFMGWFMVQSGLVDLPAVSHYRLAAHLMLAVLIFALFFHMALSFSVREDPDAARLAPMRGLVRFALACVVMTMTWGAFVAGLRAGLLYNTFPTMGGHWLPPEMLATTPIWRAFFEEPATVQFTHRILAVLTFVVLLMVVGRAKRFNPPQRLQRLLRGLFLMAFIQVGLGIATLLTHVKIALAAAHQAGAFVLVALLVWLLRDIPHKSFAKGY